MIRGKKLFALLGFLVLFLVLAKWVVGESSNGASLSLSPSSFSILSREPFSVEVFLDSGTFAIDGVDAKIKFDQSKLELVSVVKKAEETSLKTFLPIVDGNFDVASVLTKANDEGLIEFGAVSAKGEDVEPLEPFSGKTVLANLVFIPRVGFAKGETEVEVEFDPGLTTDSNVVSAEGEIQDVLSSVAGLRVTLMEGNLPEIMPIPTVIASPTLSPTPTPSPMPGPTLTQTPVKFGRIFGRILDGRGRGVFGAKVKLRVFGSERFLKSGPHGAFVFSDLPPGVFVIYASKKGFKTQSAKAFVQGGKTTIRNVFLDPKL